MHMESLKPPFVTRAARAVVGLAVRHWERTETRNIMMLPQADLGEVVTDLPPDGLTLLRHRQEFEDLLTLHTASQAEV